MEVPPQLPSTLGTLRGQIVQTSKGNLTPPKNIIQNVFAARGLYHRYRTQHLKRIDLYASIHGLIQGNPPYDPIELEQNGLSHIANFNNGDASALYEQGGLAYWNLLNAAETIIKVFFYDETNPDLKRFADIMAKQWDHVARSWASFETQVCTLTSQILQYGFGPAVWSDERDWRWQTVETSRFFVPDQASTDPDLLSTLFVESTFTVQQLYEIYNTYKDVPKGESPWNTDELSLFLVNRANTYQKFTQPILTMMDLQHRIENGDLSFDLIYSDEVRLVNMLQREYDGKFSHYIFDRVYSQSTTYTEGGGFLFFEDRQYESLHDAMVIFTAQPGVFTIHENRGLGHKIFPICQATMQLDCDVVNMGRMSSTPIIKSPATSYRDFDSIRFMPGVPTNIGSAEFVQNQLGANIEQLVFAGNYLMQKLNVNIAHSGDDPGLPDRHQGSISPSQARMKSFKEFGVLKNNIAHFYKQFDIVIKQMTKKILASKSGYPGHDLAKMWKERCLDLGVPDVLFSLNKDGTPRHFYVKATRVAGDGSTLALIMGLETLAPFVPSFSAKGVKQYQKDIVMATMGADYVAAYVGIDEPDETSGGASLAGTENAIMKMGESPLFSPDNEQRSHIVVHFELGRFIIQSRQQQQMSARQADSIFAVLIPHLQEHIQAVAQNPLQGQFFESIKPNWTSLEQYATLNRKNAEAELQSEIRKQQEAQAATQQVMTDEQRKDFQAQKDEQRKDFKVGSQVERAKEASDTRAEIMREKVQKDADNKRFQIQLEAGNESQKTLAENRRELANMSGNTLAVADFEQPTGLS